MSRTGRAIRPTVMSLSTWVFGCPLFASSLLAACGRGNSASHPVEARSGMSVPVEAAPLREPKTRPPPCSIATTQWNESLCVATAAEVRCSPSVIAQTAVGDSRWRGLFDARSHGRMSARLVDTEIQQLENLLNGMGRGSKDRPGVLRRLAEDYVDAEHLALNEKTVAEIKRDAFKQCDPDEAARQQAIADSRQIKMARSQQAAIANYTVLVTDDSLGPAAYPALDQVYYYLAYEYERAGDLANARRVYLDLIEKTPSSPFVAIGYLALGELLSWDAISDPTQWEAAKQAYIKVIATPSRRHTAYGYAWLRLGQIAEHRGDRSLARAAYTKVTEFAMNSPEVPGAVLVAAQVPDWAKQSPDAGADAGADG
jgi:TolA-binding protein